MADPVTLAVVAGGLQVGGAAAAAGQRRAAGEIKQGELEVAAKQEELASIQRESDRKNRLADALASQVASAGAGGVAAFEGSPLAIAQEDISREELATQRDVAGTRLAARTLRGRGRLARATGRAEARLGLIRGLAGAATAAAPRGQ